MLVRTARVEDATNIAALMIQVWLHTYATQGLRDAISRYVFSQFSPGIVAESISSSHQLFLVVEANGHIVGLAVLDWNATCPATGIAAAALDKLYIQEHFTGTGIGRSLLESSMEKCRERHIAKLWLTVQSANTRAVRFYLKHGFYVAGTTNFVLEDELHENYVLHRDVA